MTSHQGAVKNTTEPLACPFCGATGELIEVTPWHGGGPNKHMVSCINDHECEVLPQVTGETREQAIAIWNRRFSGTDGGVRVDAPNSPSAPADPQRNEGGA